MIITLLTDFGLKDAFVGTMKGVILGICPKAAIVDLTHEIDPQRIAGAAYVLKTAYPYFPTGAIHVCVVDPGVGTERRPICLRAQGQYFIGPDNGLFSYVLRASEAWEGVVIQNPIYRLPERGHTFHGRDVFSPAAAHLARGVPMAEFGEELRDPVTLLDLDPATTNEQMVGRVIHFDRFGNAITNITKAEFDPWRGGRTARILAGDKPVPGPLRTYAEVPPGEPLALFGSEEHLEISVNLGSAREALGLGIGTEVRVA